MLFIYARTDTGCVIGGDMAGKLGRTAEYIGRQVARNLIEDIHAGATVDRFAADQLIIYAALAHGESEYIIPRPDEHIDSNLWLVEKMSGCKTTLQNNTLRITGIGISPGL